METSLQEFQLTNFGNVDECRPLLGSRRGAGCGSPFAVTRLILRAGVYFVGQITPREHLSRYCIEPVGLFCDVECPNSAPPFPLLANTH